MPPFPFSRMVAVQAGARAGAGSHCAQLAQVQVVDVEPDRLGDPGAGPVQQLEQCPVPQRRLAGGCRREQPLHFADGDGLGQPARRRWRAHGPGRIRCGQALGERERVQPAHGDHCPAGRARGQRRVIPVAFAQPRQEVRDVLRADLPDLGPADGSQRRRIALQVTPVGLEGVLSQATFHGQVVEIPRDRARECRQLSTSARVSDGSPCASATGAQVTSPRGC